MTASGVVVVSKNEVIVATVLDEVAPRRWAYETPLKGVDGRTLHPDFTIQRPDGTLVLWEHLGLMNDLEYARKWALKKEWYSANGFLPHPQRGYNGTLMWTDDARGVRRAGLAPPGDRRRRPPGRWPTSTRASRSRPTCSVERRSAQQFYERVPPAAPSHHRTSTRTNRAPACNQWAAGQGRCSSSGRDRTQRLRLLPGASRLRNRFDAEP